MCVAMSGCSMPPRDSTPPSDSVGAHCVHLPGQTVVDLDWSPSGKIIAALGMGREGAAFLSVIDFLTGDVTSVPTSDRFLEFGITAADDGVFWQETLSDQVTEVRLWRTGDPTTIGRIDGFFLDLDLRPEGLYGLLPMYEGDVHVSDALVAVDLEATPLDISVEQELEAAVRLTSTGTAVLVSEQLAGEPMTAQVQAPSGVTDLSLPSGDSNAIAPTADGTSVFYRDISTGLVNEMSVIDQSTRSVDGSAETQALDVSLDGTLASSSSNPPDQNASVCFSGG
jgi:hypothetical protein